MTYDKFGPEYVIRVADPAIGMQGFLVIDNTALGMGKGGVRMSASITEEEVYRLARTMTWKNALAGIPFGGAKSGIVWNGGSDELKKQFVQSFARKIKPFVPKTYITGPDVNTGEREMQWFVEATKDWRTATGKPSDLCMVFAGKNKRCGIPHELGSTGFGVAKVTAVAAKLIKLPLKGARVAIHGFGNVGTFTYKLLLEKGVKVVALSDASAAISSSAGLDSKILMEFIANKTMLSKYPKRAHIAQENFWRVPTDILVPASITDVLNERNKMHINTKLIVEGGNIPMSEKIEKELFKKGVVIIPDFVANAGGVISSYAEYKGYAPNTMFKLIEEKLTKSATDVVTRSLSTHKHTREVAMAIAQERVEAAMAKKKRV